MKKYPKNITDALDKLMEYGADLTDYVIISQQSWANGYSIKDLLNSQELLEEKDKQIKQYEEILQDKNLSIQLYEKDMKKRESELENALEMSCRTLIKVLLYQVWKEEKNPRKEDDLSAIAVDYFDLYASRAEDFSWDEIYKLKADRDWDEFCGAITNLGDKHDND